MACPTLADEGIKAFGLQPGFAARRGGRKDVAHGLEDAKNRPLLSS